MYCYNEEDENLWQEEKIDNCLDSLCEMLNLARYKNYFAIIDEESSYRTDAGQWIQFYTKEEVGQLIKELQILHSLMEETDNRPDDCDDILEDFEFEEREDE